MPLLAEVELEAGKNGCFSEEHQAGRGLCELCWLTRHPGIAVLARPPGEVDSDPLKAKGPVFYTDQTGILDTLVLGAFEPVSALNRPIFSSLVLPPLSTLTSTQRVWGL